MTQLSPIDRVDIQRSVIDALDPGFSDGFLHIEKPHAIQRLYDWRRKGVEQSYDCSPAYAEGVIAAAKYMREQDNPYNAWTQQQQFVDWRAGYNGESWRVGL